MDLYCALEDGIPDKDFREFAGRHAFKIASLYEVGYRDIRIERDGAGKILLRTPEDDDTTGRQRSATALLRKDSARLKRDVAGLKRKVAELERTAARTVAEAARLRKKTIDPHAKEVKKAKFGPKLISSLRRRLKLSQQDFGKLAGVSGQAVLSWEKGKSSPRAEAKAELVELRRIGVREARRRLEELPQD